MITHDMSYEVGALVIHLSLLPVHSGPVVRPQPLEKPSIARCVATTKFGGLQCAHRSAFPSLQACALQQIHAYPKDGQHGFYSIAG